MLGPCEFCYSDASNSSEAPWQHWRLSREGGRDGVCSQDHPQAPELSPKLLPSAVLGWSKVTPGPQPRATEQHRVPSVAGSLALGPAWCGWLVAAPCPTCRVGQSLLDGCPSSLWGPLFKGTHTRALGTGVVVTRWAVTQEGRLWLGENACEVNPGQQGRLAQGRVCTLMPTTPAEGPTSA